MKNLFRQKNVLYLLFPFALILALIAAGSLVDFSQYPSAAADGAAWDKNWEMMAKVVGIEAPGDGLTLFSGACGTRPAPGGSTSAAVGSRTPKLASCPAPWWGCWWGCTPSCSI